MKHSALTFLFLLAATVTFSQSSTLKGVIETAEEDEQHVTTAVNLMVDKIEKGGFKTEYYRIINKNKGVELLNHVDKSVEITGIIKGGGSKKKLLVTDYKVLPSEEEQEPEKLEAPPVEPEKENPDSPVSESAPDTAKQSEQDLE
jgi:hypothetical protein